MNSFKESNTSIIRTKEASHSYKKIFIDARHRASGNSATFTVNLPEVLDMSHNHRFCIDDICLPRSWYTIGANNSTLYVASQSNNTTYLVAVFLSQGDYDGNTLATEIQNKLNTGAGFGPNLFTVSFNRNLGKLQISHPTIQFWFPTDNELVEFSKKNMYFSQEIAGVMMYFDLSKLEVLNSANNVIGNITDGRGYRTLLVLDPINLNWLDVIYIHAVDFGGYNTLNLRGDKTIVKEVKVSEQPFTYIFDNANYNNDWMDCSHQQWSQLTFSLRDKLGREVLLNNRDISFSIVLEDLTV